MLFLHETFPQFSIVMVEERPKLRLWTRSTEYSSETECMFEGGDVEQLNKIANVKPSISSYSTHLM